MAKLTRPIFRSDRRNFLRTNDSLKDMVFGHMAIDIDRAIKMDAGTPVESGDMKAETRAYKSRNNQWRVESPKDYSEVQEKGQRMSGPGAPTAMFQHYTTPGTDKGWFKRAIDLITLRADNYVDEARRALNL